MITGASRGIGRAAACAYASEGAHVILISRTRGGLEETDDMVKERGGTATLVPLNLAHAAKVDAIGPSLIERFAHIDILVGNAAKLGPLSPLGHIHGDNWQAVMELNVTANWRLIRSLDPLLRRSDAGRAIFVTSGAAQSCKAYWGPYSVSKAALEALVKTYAHEIANTNVRANLLDPHVVRTAMRAKAVPGEDPNTIPPPEALGDVFVRMALPAFNQNGEIIRALDEPEFNAFYAKS